MKRFLALVAACAVLAALPSAPVRASSGARSSRPLESILEIVFRVVFPFGEAAAAPDEAVGIGIDDAAAGQDGMVGGDADHLGNGRKGTGGGASGTPVGLQPPDGSQPRGN